MNAPKSGRFYFFNLFCDLVAFCSGNFKCVFVKFIFYFNLCVQLAYSNLRFFYFNYLRVIWLQWILYTVSIN